MEHRLDPWLVLALMAILSTSLATLHAASPAIGGDLFLRQLFWSCGGLALLLALSRLQLAAYERLAPVIYAVSLASLVAVLFFGEVRGGNRAWFGLGPLTLQPSEFARVATALMLATWLARRPRGSLSLREQAVAAAIVGAPVGLILLQPDLGVAVTYSPLLIATYWLGGVPVRTWAVAAVLVVVGGVVAWHGVLKPYQKERVLTLLDSERAPYGAGYQVRQSKIAVGSGMVLGRGLGSGSQALLRFLPAQHTDFVFAAWAEATGFVGASFLLLAYGLLLARIGAVIGSAETRHGMAVAALVGSTLAFQTVVNLGIVLGWLPTTGITLPLFSYGGSSLLSTCSALGVVQCVWRHRFVYQ